MDDNERNERKKLAHKKWRDNNKEKIKEDKKKYYETNKDEIRLKQAKYNQDNKEKIKDINKQYYKNNKDKFKNYSEINSEKISKARRERYLKNKDKESENRRIWYEANKDEVRENYRKWIKNRRLNDPLFKLKSNVRSSIKMLLNRGGYSKKSKTEDILGCSFEELKEYIESQWEDWMSWENYGKYNGEVGYGWDIDHKIPTSSAINEDDVIKLNHFNNLQPLCSYINRYVKRDKFNY